MRRHVPLPLLPLYLPITFFPLVSPLGPRLLFRNMHVRDVVLPTLGWMLPWGCVGQEVIYISSQRVLWCEWDTRQTIERADLCWSHLIPVFLFLHALLPLHLVHQSSPVTSSLCAALICILVVFTCVSLDRPCVVYVIRQLFPCWHLCLYITGRQARNVILFIACPRKQANPSSWSVWPVHEPSKPEGHVGNVVQSQATRVYTPLTPFHTVSSPRRASYPLSASPNSPQTCPRHRVHRICLWRVSLVSAVSLPCLFRCLWDI